MMTPCTMKPFILYLSLVSSYLAAISSNDLTHMSWSVIVHLMA